MLREKISVLLIIIAICSVLAAGCYKNTTIMDNAEGEISRPVSFANDIMPVFNKSCNSSGCHNAGGKPPNLTAANAYNVLTGGNYVNTGDPKSSELYLWMAGKKGTPMPLSGPDKDYNALILAWIKQGAANN